MIENISRIEQEELLETLGTMQRNVLLEAQLIDDILDLTRISRGKIELRFEAVDMRAVLQDVLGICQQEITIREQRVSSQLEAPEYWVWADPTRIRQVFWNLINNAVKFTPKGGSISIRAYSNRPEQLMVDISDTGVGIEPEQLSRIFEAFEQGERTVTRRFGGLGLGLAITRSLVEMHHGLISVESEGKGKGATFKVELATVSHPATEKKSESLPETVKRLGLRILLVDDHEDTRRILTRLLMRQGHRVEAAESVKAALAFLKDKRFDVLISDIGLPDGSGLEIMSKARQQQAELRGIALSGFGMEEDVRRSMDAGFGFHLIKPVNMTVLRELLMKISASI